MLAVIALAACHGDDGVRDPAVAALPIRKPPIVPSVVKTFTPAESTVELDGLRTAHLTPGQIIAVLQAMNQGELAQAQVALAQASTQPPKTFAQVMVRDHAMALQEVAQIADSLHAAPEPSAALEHTQRAGAQVIAEIRPLSGLAFDRKYMDEQVHVHQAALDAIDQVLMPDAKDPLLQGLLQRLRGTVNDHLQVAIQVRAGLG